MSLSTTENAGEKLCIFCVIFSVRLCRVVKREKFRYFKGDSIVIKTFTREALTYEAPATCGHYEKMRYVRKILATTLVLLLRYRGQHPTGLDTEVPK